MDDRLRAYREIASVEDTRFVDELYRHVLRRDPDAAGRERAVASLCAGTLSRATLLHELVSSAEFARVRALDDAVALSVDARAREARPRELIGPPGLDERVIEIPWTLARYRGERRVLDIGSANAEPAYLTALAAAAPVPPTAVDLAERTLPGYSMVTADLRDLPFANGSFDVVFCISTLEHIGRDNRVYGVDAAGGEGFAAALSELNRVLARDGRLLVTVPCGAPEDHGWFVQRPAEEWLALFAGARLEVFEQETYGSREDGWRAIADASGARYGERGPGASAVLCAELRPRSLRSSVRRLARAALPGGRDG